MKEFKVEQLIVLNKDGGFCNNTKSFNQLLQSNSDIVIVNNKLKYKKELEVSYSLICDDIEGKDQRFFQISLVMSSGESSLDVFVELQREIRRVISKAGGSPEILVDDVSTYYANKSYPHIHRIENLLRKLITSFMIRKVGSSYVSDASPNEFKRAIDSSKRDNKSYMNAMYQVDFKHLSDFLFKPYTRKKESDLHQIIRKANNISELNISDLKEYIPRSNWQRYFSKEVDCEDTFLSKKWEALYELRCMIAHNAIVNKETFVRIFELVEEVEKILEEAVDKLYKIDVPESDKDIIAENVVSNIDDSYAEFLKIWVSLEEVLNELRSFLLNFEKVKKVPAMVVVTSNGAKLSPTNVLLYLNDCGYIADSIVDEVRDIIHFRNQLVHGIKSYLSPSLSSELLAVMDRSNKICEYMIDFSYNFINQKIIVTTEDRDGFLYIENLLPTSERLRKNSSLITSMKNKKFKSNEDIIKFFSEEFFIHESNVLFI